MSQKKRILIIRKIKMPYITAGLSHILNVCGLGVWVGLGMWAGCAGWEWECGRVGVWECVWVCGLGVWECGSVGWVCGLGVWECGLRVRVGVGVWVGSVGVCGRVGWECGWVWECGLGVWGVGVWSSLSV
ncbi:hypothetical protein RhiirA5_451443 [Rhizophagus irregularis]|uniref:Uncharacterized protein n=1 Tax=Rhizophagus irregularis TaxID=588596 RepID=A0A2N0P989_9GLOM|nr:hypothetical protein RhiirA5_451443 [Rhizophagus irregularis]